MSAACPAKRKRAKPGRNWARPTYPRSMGRRVISYTCQATATDCISSDTTMKKRATVKETKLGWVKATRPARWGSFVVAIRLLLCHRIESPRETVPLLDGRGRPSPHEQFSGV